MLLAELPSRMHFDDELGAIAGRCTPGALGFLRKVRDRDKDLFPLVIEALKATDGTISDGTIFVALIQLKDELFNAYKRSRR